MDKRAEQLEYMKTAIFRQEDKIDVTEVKNKLSVLIIYKIVIKMNLA